MKHYLKIDNNTVVEAPKNITKGDKFIYGYNHEANDAMLKQDGYTPYDLPACMYEVKNGAIVEKQFVPQEKTVFTKLQIRRACRELGFEDKLDDLLNSDETIKKDWTDAQDIDLNDNMFILAIQAGVFTAEQVETIKGHLR